MVPLGQRLYAFVLVALLVRVRGLECKRLDDDAAETAPGRECHAHSRITSALGALRRRGAACITSASLFAVDERELVNTLSSRAWRSSSSSDSSSLKARSASLFKWAHRHVSGRKRTPRELLELFFDGSAACGRLWLCR